VWLHVTVSVFCRLIRTFKDETVTVVDLSNHAIHRIAAASVAPVPDPPTTSAVNVTSVYARAMIEAKLLSQQHLAAFEEAHSDLRYVFTSDRK
jgi:hypothetical protein